MLAKVVLYCDNSTFCHSARQFLRFHKVEFEDIDIPTDDGFSEFSRVTRDSLIPAFLLRKSHSVQLIVGLDKPLLERVLGLNKGVQKAL